jgi:toxin ParE1/3/4
MAHRIAPAAEADLDGIWYYVAKQSASIEVANHLIDSISNRFLLPADHPYLGRSRDTDLGPRTRSFAVGEYVIVYSVEGEDVLVLRVVHGRRDLEAVFGG